MATRRKVRRLRRTARRRGYTAERQDSYVYGTLAKERGKRRGSR